MWLHRLADAYDCPALKWQAWRAIKQVLGDYDNQPLQVLGRPFLDEEEEDEDEDEDEREQRRAGGEGDEEDEDDDEIDYGDEVRASEAKQSEGKGRETAV